MRAILPELQVAQSLADLPVATSPPALRTAGLTKAFAGNVVLRDVSFEALPGEVHALVGENGAGKSTLINLVTGVVQPDAGKIALGGEVVAGLTPRAAEARGVATVHQELSLCPHLTVAENVYLGKAPTRGGLRGGWLDTARMEAGARAALVDLGAAIDPRMVAGELSLADQQLVELAKALVAAPKLLILDEATSALDAGQVQRLFAALRRLRARGVAVVFVSHRLEEVFAIADRITVLRNGAYVATVPAAGTTVADLVKLMVGREMEDIFPPKPPVEAVLGAPVVLSVSGLASGRRFRDVSFDLHRGEILGLGGLQGQGQRELLAALFGLHPVQGEVLLDGQPATVRGPRSAMRRGIAHVPEDRKTDGLIVQLPVRENLSLPSLPALDRFGLLDPGRERRLVDGLIDKLRIRLRSPRQTLLRLSGGNQQKVAIAKWLPLRPEIYLLAEPTRGIDVGTKQEIYRLMRELTAGGASILLISSDTIELLGLCDRVLVMYERQPVAMLGGAEVTEERVVHASVAGHGVAIGSPERRLASGGADVFAELDGLAGATVPELSPENGRRAAAVDSQDVEAEPTQSPVPIPANHVAVIPTKEESVLVSDRMEPESTDSSFVGMTRRSGPESERTDSSFLGMTGGVGGVTGRVGGVAGAVGGVPGAHDRQVANTGDVSPSRPHRRARLPRAWQDVAPIFGVTLLFVLLYVVLTRQSLSLGTLNNLSAYLFPLILVAMAQSVVMLTGGIDLAVGAMMSLTTVVLATQMYDSLGSKIGAVALVVVGGALLGLLTGAVVTLIRLPAIIVTLATSFIWAGWALYVLSVPGGHLPVSFAREFTGQIGGVVPATLVVLAVTLLLWKAVKRTPLGLNIYAVGDNPRGAFVSGVPTRTARIAAYAIAGALTAVAGIGLSAYAATGDPLIGAPYALASIAGAVLGGVSFLGGQGQLKGAVAGALTLGLMTQILFISGLSPAYQRVIYGAVLIVALGVRAFAAYRIEEAR